MDNALYIISSYKKIYNYVVTALKIANFDNMKI